MTNDEGANDEERRANRSFRGTPRNLSSVAPPTRDSSEYLGMTTGAEFVIRVSSFGFAQRPSFRFRAHLAHRVPHRPQRRRPLRPRVGHVISEDVPERDVVA